MPPALLQSLKEQGLTDALDPPPPTRPADGAAPVVRDYVPRVYDPKSSDPEDAATQVHQGGNKVALGPPPDSSAATLLSPTTTARLDGPPVTTPSGVAAPPVASSPTNLASTAPLGAASPVAVAAAKFAAPPHAPPGPPSPSAFAPVAPAPPGPLAPVAPPAGPFGGGPSYAPPQMAYAPSPYDAAPVSNARWIAVALVSFVVALAVFGAVVVRYVL